MTTQSQILTDFYKAYEIWADLGIPDSGIFNNKTGLCDNLGDYLNVVRFRSSKIVLDEMKTQFTDAGLSAVYPFNDQNGVGYEDDSWNGMTNNPKRMAWVRDHAK